MLSDSSNNARENIEALQAEIDQQYEDSYGNPDKKKILDLANQIMVQGFKLNAKNCQRF